MTAYNLKKGFTLIELLVVISIIGILSSIITVSFTSSQKQARDTKRKSDLKQYQNALEVYANKNNGMYPAWQNSPTQASGDQMCLGSLATIITNGSCPEDPKYSIDPSKYIYYYQSNGGSSSGAPVATQYILWDQLEAVSTTTYWVVCSTGQSGKTTVSPSGTAGTCPTFTP